MTLVFGHSSLELALGLLLELVLRLDLKQMLSLLFLRYGPLDIRLVLLIGVALQIY
jgi:hypothetical protein